MDIIRYLVGAIGITTPMILASTLAPQGTSSDLILDICRKVGARSYLAGPLSRLYLNEDSFRGAGISVRYHEFEHPIYVQFGRDSFTSHLCSIDLLMNQGRRSLETIRQGTQDVSQPSLGTLARTQITHVSPTDAIQDWLGD